MMVSTYQPEEVVKALLSDHVNMSEGLARYVRQYRLELNHKGVGAWTRLSNEKNLYVLTALFFLWLEHLKLPLFGSEELTNIVLRAAILEETLKRLPVDVAHTVDYILRFFVHLDPSDEYIEPLLKRLAASLTHRSVSSSQSRPIPRGFHEQTTEKGNHNNTCTHAHC